jgi:hypothetical protein
MQYVKNSQPNNEASPKTSAPRAFADAVLFAMIADVQAAEARLDDAAEEVNAAAGRTVCPRLPVALIRKASDRVELLWSMGLEEIGRPFDAKEIALLRQCKSRRAREVVGAFDFWQSEREAAFAASGLTEAEGRRAEALEAVKRAYISVAQTPAKTAAGVLAKLALVADDYGPIVALTKGTNDDVVASSALDAARLRAA